METFTLDPRCWRVARIFGRNPLLRPADRIEALVVLIAVVASLVAIPVAGVVGAVAYGARERLCAQEARDRHVVTATVADTRLDDSGTRMVQATWPATAGERTGTLRLTASVKAGERIQIWVDTDANPASPPTPAWRAVIDAVGMVAVTLLIVGVGMAALVAAVRSRLDRARDAQWEREIRCLADDGGRTNR
ncbi:Rv1733c family protein [Mycobacterium malmoense]|uniref:Rv1733c family protein n=1 Tax=Mycobacterium malmoense TaxID=1780 RepID=UPI0008F8D367|nr:hypothetical protein [Mycobacterium malmoense]OIN78938.1 hypothetical protein BMG05_20860 [Mycobacterium malmoense]